MFKLHSPLRLVQFKEDDGVRRVGVVGEKDNDDRLFIVDGARSTYELANEAIKSHSSLEEIAQSRVNGKTAEYGKIVSENRLLPPLDHPDPAHFLISGTGLDHLGSAIARDAMHAKKEEEEAKLTDSMKMFRVGLEGGKPGKGHIGAQPEWFYKGDGSCVVPPGHPLHMPSFALDGGEEAEIVGLYINGESGTFRVGFALGNEFSDHVLEKKNYLYLAHSKLRECSIGPELLIGDLPQSVTGSVKILRKSKEIWSSTFLTGEANMVHGIANLEHHHFKYEQFRRPGDVHCHFFGAAVLSFTSGVKTERGDIFVISSPTFGRELKNELSVEGEHETPLAVESL